MKALILAGGRGKRLADWTQGKNKSMIKLFEKPLIEHNLEHAVEAGVKEIIIVIGYKGEEIKKYFGNEYRGIPVKYVVQKEQKGLVHAIETSKQALEDSDFILMLADEVIIDARLKEMIGKFRKEELFGVCGVVLEKDKLSISKTYSVMINEKGRIFRLIEKPKIPINNIKGTGHCILKNKIFEYIERTPINANRGEKELVDLIQVAIDDGKKVYIYKLSESYVNINTKEDHRLAEELIKKQNPRVLIVHTQMRFLGGAELLIVELANWLTKRGIKNDILALSSSKEVEEKLINTEIIIPEHNIELHPPGFKSIKDILNFIKIYKKEIKRLRKNYDVINLHNFPVTWSVFPNKKPVVWMLNEPPNLWSKPNAGFMLKTLNKFRNWLDKFIIRYSVDVVCVADEFNKKRALERYGLDARVVYYGVNYDFFSKGNAGKAGKKFGLEGKFIAIHSGQLTEVKNQLESIRVVERVKDKIPNILLILAGQADESYKKKLEKYVEGKKLSKYILFTGNLKREELRDLYKASDVGLYPIGKQGGWLAPFENLSASTPVIVSNELGAAGIIKQFKLGIVTKDYEKALLEVYNNQNKYKQQAKHASKFINKNLGWNVFSDKLIKAFKDAWSE